MGIDFITLALAVVCFLTGMIISWFLTFLRAQILAEKIKTANTREITSLQERVKTQEELIDQFQNEKTILNENSADLTNQNEQLGRKLAVAEQQAALVNGLNEEIVQLNTRNTSLLTEITQLKTRDEGKNDQIAFFNKAKDEMTTQFQTLANNIFEEKDKIFLERSEKQLGLIFNPFDKQLRDFKQKIDDVHISGAKDRASLITELGYLRNSTQQLNEDAINLTRALKGDKRLQGHWGEYVLERVLELSGLRKEDEYKVQVGFRDSHDKLLRPDVIIHLPDNRDIIVDSKVSLNSYERYVSAVEEEDELEAQKQLAQDIRAHIKVLAGKDYSTLKAIRSLDLVLMFIPLEPAFSAALQHDRELLSYAFEQKIVIVNPTTLLVALKTIENIWRYERQNQNTLAIADKAGAIYNKLKGFLDDIEKIGRGLNSVQQAHDDAMNKLTRGKGNLVGQAQKFVDLGVKVKKEISRFVIELHQILIFLHQTCCK